MNKINPTNGGALSQSDPTYAPIYSPPSGGLTPKLYLYIVGELASPGIGEVRRKILLDHLYLSSVVNDIHYESCVSGHKHLIKILGFGLDSGIQRLSLSYSDRKFASVYDSILEDGIQDSLMFVLSSFSKLKSLDAKMKTVPRYTNGGLKVKRTIKYTVKPSYLVAFIMQQWTCDYKNALDLIAALGALTNRIADVEIERYGIDTGQFSKLPQKMKDIFVDRKYIYYLKDSESIGLAMSEWLNKIEGKTFDTGIKFIRTQSLVVLKEDFEMMSLRGKMICMRNLHRYEDGKLYIYMKIKQSFGNYGRQYNVLTELSRSDRKYISNLYGVDMEAALQTILYRIFQPLGYALPYTFKYITKKDEVRATLKKHTGLSKNAVKALITAVYQGKTFGGEYHRFIGEILRDGATLRKAILDIELDDKKHKEALRYATHACKHSAKVRMTRLQYERSENKTKRLDYEKSFMFFFWTFYERQIQDVISSEFSHPIPLHDAVYTQNIDEFKDFNIKEIEQKIVDETGIHMRLSEE